MRAAICLALLPVLALGATVTPGPWTLYRGTSIVQPRVDYASQAACVAAADKLEPRTYTCRTITTVVVEAAPAPVNCAVSAWGAWQPGAWSACANGSQSRTETRSRTITTQPANGGTACPALSETRTVIQSCTVAPQPTTARNQCWSGPLNAYRVCADGVVVLSRATAGPYGDWSGGTDKLWQNVAPNEAVYVCELERPIGFSDWCPSNGDANARFVLKSSLGPPSPAPTGAASLSWLAPTVYADSSPLPATDLAAFRVYRGDSANSLSRIAEVSGSARAYEVGQLATGTHHFAVSAVSVAGVEGPLSDVRSKTIQ